MPSSRVLLPARPPLDASKSSSSSTTNCSLQFLTASLPLDTPTPMSDADWLSLLRRHPIFKDESAGQLSTSHLKSTSTGRRSRFGLPSGSNDVDAAYGRRSLMCMRGSDLIVAVGNRVRMMSLVDAKAGEGSGSYKSLDVPSVLFEIRQMALNSTEKLLAVGGTHQVAVIILPRRSYNRQLTPEIKCKCFIVGPFHHASPKASPLAKIDWHPLGEGGASLIVLTEDGVVRDYNVFEDAEEPKQVVSFFDAPLSRRVSRGFSADAPRRAVSFTFGQGRDDWGPLTLLGLTNSGDVWALCPFMPKRGVYSIHQIKELNAAAGAKLSEMTEDPSKHSPVLELRYQHQLRYFNAMLRQLKKEGKKESKKKPAKRSVDKGDAGRKQDHDRLEVEFDPDAESSGTDEIAAGEAAFTLPPLPTVKARVASQGPYRLQPSPIDLKDSPGGEATDIIYLFYEHPKAAPLSVVAIAYSDGRVDICLDLEKVEGKWLAEADASPELPVLSVYETIDLGLCSSLSTALGSSSLAKLGDRLRNNYPVFLQDPVYPDTLYVYHDLGVHCLVLRKWVSQIQEASIAEDDALSRALGAPKMTEVGYVVNSISSMLEPPTAVTSLAIVHDVYLSYGLLALTSSLTLVASELNLRVEKEQADTLDLPLTVSRRAPGSTYVSLLEKEPFVLPEMFTRSANLPHTPVGTLPVKENSAEGLRLFGKQVEELRAQIRDFAIAGNVVQDRIGILGQELRRQLAALVEIQEQTKKVKENGEEELRPRLDRIMEYQTQLLRRTDGILQRLMDSVQPVLTDAELAWFDELNKMDDDITGKKVDSLQTRQDSLAWQIAALESEMVSLAGKDRGAYRQGGAKPTGIGKAQLDPLEQRLRSQSTTLQDAKDKIMEVKTKLELIKERFPPPSTIDRLKR